MIAARCCRSEILYSAMAMAYTPRVGGGPRIVGCLVAGVVLLPGCGPTSKAAPSGSNPATSVSASGSGQASFKTAAEAAIGTINRYEAGEKTPGPQFLFGTRPPAHK